MNMEIVAFSGGGATALTFTNLVCDSFNVFFHLCEFRRTYMSPDNAAPLSASVVHSVMWGVPDSSCQCPPLHYYKVPLDIAP